MINWTRAIERNREALLRIVAALFAMAGLAEGEIRSPLCRAISTTTSCAFSVRPNPPSAA